MSRMLLTLIIGLAGALAITAAAALQPARNEADAAAGYIRTLQNGDGGFPAFGAESSPGSTIDAVFALRSAGLDPATITTNGSSPFDYLATAAASYSADPGGAAKLALGVSYAGADLSSFGGVDLLAVMDGALDPATGAYGLDLFDHAFYVFAAISSGGNPAPEAVQYLLDVQQPDGGWEFAPGAGSDVNTTALVLQALIAAGEGPGSPEAPTALDYLAGAQNGDGGFGFLPGEPTDPNSTAFVVQALVSAGEAIDAGRWARDGTPLEALISFQNPETGAFQFAGEDSPFATYQSVPALMLAPFPHLQTRVIEGPAPQAPTATDVTPLTPAPAATATVAPAALPPSGGASPPSTPWPAIVLLATAGAAAIGGAALLRRRA